MRTSLWYILFAVQMSRWIRSCENNTARYYYRAAPFTSESDYYADKPRVAAFFSFVRRWSPVLLRGMLVLQLVSANIIFRIAWDDYLMDYGEQLLRATCILR